MARLIGVREQRTATYYDTLIGAGIDQVSNLRTTLFGNTNIGCRSRTNMVIGGVLPNDNSFAVTNMTCLIDLDPELCTWFGANCHLSLVVGESPLVDHLPAAFALVRSDGVALAPRVGDTNVPSSAMADPDAGKISDLIRLCGGDAKLVLKLLSAAGQPYRLDVPIVIPTRQSFYAWVDLDQYPEFNQRPGQKHVKVCLRGIEARDIL